MKLKTAALALNEGAKKYKYFHRRPGLCRNAFGNYVAFINGTKAITLLPVRYDLVWHLFGFSMDENPVFSAPFDAAM